MRSYHVRVLILRLLINIEILLINLLKKCRNVKNVHFKKTDPEVKKHVIFTFHDYLSQFTLKMETVQLKGWLSPFWDLEMYDTCMHLYRLFILG